MNGARGAMVAPPLLRNSDHAARASRRPNGTLTYNARDKHLGGVTYGGYSDSVVVDERFVLRVPSNLADTRARALSPRSRP
jgi:D-arabinose 1-dehydrogenase-like Zn-dependent alcohol dehydrogenase